MSKTRVFTSFDYDNDKVLKEFLNGQSKNEDSPFSMVDCSIKEAIDENWKKVARARISKVDVVAVICGEYTNKASGVSAEVKIAQELGKPYFLLKGYSGKECKKPIAARGSDNMYDWTWHNLKLLIGGSR